VGIYRDLAKHPGVLRILFAQLTARMPFGMISIVILLHIQQLHGNFAAAGLVLAAASLGEAIAGPLTSRWMGIWGMRRVLIATSVICASGLIILGTVFMPLALTMLVAFVMGISAPPVSPAVRTIYPKIVPGKQLVALYSLDASAQEIIWIFGPVIAVLISTQISTTAGMFVLVGFLLIGGFWFVMSPEVGRVHLPRSRKRMGAILGRPTVLLSSLIGLIFVASFGAVEVGVVAAFDKTSLESGVVLAIFSVGSIIGGLLIGHRPVTAWSLTVRLAIVTIGTALTVFNQGAFWLSVSLFIAGIGVAPALAVLYTMISATVKFSETAEAFGWLSTGTLVGVSLGAAAAGFAVDAFGSVGGLVVSLIAVFLSTVLAGLTHRHIPNLASGDASPIPETEPIRVTNR
jgi:MFS family permease